MRSVLALGIFVLAIASAAQTAPRSPAPARLAIVPPERPVCREQQRCVIDLLASGGRGPYDWSIIQGKLPAGLSLDRHTGRISGIPTVPGQSTVTTLLRDGVGQSAQLRITITIQSLLEVVWQSAPALNETNLAGSLRVSNYSGNETMVTVIVVAVNEINKAFALGYQHFSLAAGATSPVIPFGMQMPPGRYRVRVDAVGEVAAKNLIYRTALEAGPFATP